MPKTESRGQYRRREDQYLCIEIQPESNGLQPVWTQSRHALSISGGRANLPARTAASSLG